MAHDGLARAIRPAHTMLDGDTIFALSTGNKNADVTTVGAYAAEAMAEAILRAVQAAEPAGGLPGTEDRLAHSAFIQSSVRCRVNPGGADGTSDWWAGYSIVSRGDDPWWHGYARQHGVKASSTPVGAAATQSVSTRSRP